MCDTLPFGVTIDLNRCCSFSVLSMNELNCVQVTPFIPV